MSYQLHHAIIVTVRSDKDGKHWIEIAHEKATEIFGRSGSPRSLCPIAQVTPPTTGCMNNVRSFLIAPDGSGEGCEESDTGDAARAEFIAWMRDQEYGFDGSDWEGSPLQWVEAAFGEEEHRPPKIVAEYADPARRDADEGL